MKNIDEKELMNAASKLNINVNDLKTAADDGKIEDYINKNLSSDAAKKLKSVMSDKNTVEKLLSTPQAKAVLDKMMKK